MEAHAGGRLDAVVAHCGPVALSVIAETPALRSRVLAELEQFNARWDDPCALIRVRVHVANEPRALGDGRLLHCSGIRVDTARPGLVATCASGASGRGLTRPRGCRAGRTRRVSQFRALAYECW